MNALREGPMRIGSPRTRSSARRPRSCEVVREGLAEADPRVDEDPLAAHPAATAAPPPAASGHTTSPDEFP